MLSILNAVPDFSKMEAGKLRVAYLPTPVRELAGSVVLLSSAYLGAHAAIHQPQ